MKTKLEMAHEYAIALINSNSENMEFDKFIQLCWKYADAMQAEVDKREHKHMFLNNEPCICGVTMNDVANKPSDINDWHEIRGEEWQPDWSQAPDNDVQYFAVDEDGQGGWYITKQTLCSDHWYWSEWGERKPAYDHAPSFGYTGDWRESLRKRPQ